MFGRCDVRKCRAVCCYNIPFANGELDRFADRIVTPVLERMPVGIPSKALLGITSRDYRTNRCPFLTKDYRCNIYDNRPDVCRKFGEIGELPCQFRKNK